MALLSESGMHFVMPGWQAHATDGLAMLKYLLFLSPELREAR